MRRSASTPDLRPRTCGRCWTPAARRRSGPRSGRPFSSSARCCAGCCGDRFHDREVAMGALGRIGAFIVGGALGAGVGAAVAMLVAPQSGDEFVESVERRIDHVKVAGLEAQARTEEELIR